MSTDQQISANRLNAKKSTGPRTKAGKERASRNPLKHGLCALDLLTPDENPDDYEAFHNDALASLKPVGFLETELAETIINVRWRLRRCERIEAGLLGGGKYVMGEIETTSIESFARMLESDVSPEDCTFSQLLQHLMVMRIEADFEQRCRKDPSLAPFSSEDRSQASRKTRSFSEIPNEVLVELFKEASEEEHQKNPLSYDIAHAFKRDTSGEDVLTKLGRYEAGLDRKLHRALCDFRHLQSERKAHAAEAARVTDVIDLNQQ